MQIFGFQVFGIQMITVELFINVNNFVAGTEEWTVEIWITEKSEH